MNPRSLEGALRAIELLVLDFDGVMTDNRVLVHEDGTEGVWCNRADGWGIEQLKARTDIEVLVLSTERNPVVASRCRKLGIDFTQASADKGSALRELADGRGLEASQIAYVGNDVNDLACLQWVGLPIAVADSSPEVLEVAEIITEKNGGYGAVREVCDLLLDALER